MNYQTMLDGFITCDKCRFGRELGANDYGCRNEKRRADGEKTVNKADFTCGEAKEKEE